MKAIFYPSLLILLLCQCSCIIPTNRHLPINSENASNNATYRIHYLFEHDGCKVYKFYDFGNPVYFTSCAGNTTAFVDTTAIIKNQTIIKNK